MSSIDIKQNNAKKKKIGLIISNKTNYYSASSYIRLLSPFNELKNQYSVEIIDDERIVQFKEDLNKENIVFDIIIIQRDILLNPNINDFKFIKKLYFECEKQHIPIIFDIDDDLLNIESTHVDYNKYNEIQDILKFILINSDIITVTNNILKKQISKLDKNITIKIIPNTLVKLWGFPKKQQLQKNLTLKNTVKIGYFGGISHKDDLKIIEKPMKNVINHFTNKNIIFEVIGITNDNYKWITKINIPNNYNSNPTLPNKIKNNVSKILRKVNLYDRGLPFCSFVNWIKNEIDWDIAVAPLEDTNINRSKSNLKYLEYTALNIPGVYSNIGPYKEIGEKNTGIVVNNTPEEWEKALINLIEDNELYETILKNAHEDVRNNYLVKNSVEKWEKILKEI